MDSPAGRTRSRASKLATTPNGEPTATTMNRPAPAVARTGQRHPPFLPTPLEGLVLSLFPALLLFGGLFSLVSPETRAAPYDPMTQAHAQEPHLAPSYFARKSNLFNTLFVKKGWAWITLAFFVFVLSHPFHGRLGATTRRIQAIIRWGLITTWWIFITQWFFGPAIIDRGFRWTGGKCDVAEEKLEVGVGDAKDVFTAVACKAAGGKWSGGHDISGHVFMLVLGSVFLLQEVGWVVLRWRGRREDRSVVMMDGAVKSAGVETIETPVETGLAEDALGVGGKTALAVVALSCWMLLMTAIYFHTWFEKLTGLLTALVAVYAVYILPRPVPALRRIVGLPGV